ncbi:MutS-like protein [Natranaerovirga pectinivora]|uniref:MutS-like protein n=1 Tax=Natranaerovirga pectinivora TaxID=682400 RepID=A0A4R3MTR6_9FIRM|nr:DNA mismatch repair protein MutS [Natranaerovirga pectinivora]TCT17110.1 MutS-like protein [Natranaerovirga pectinivora]
MKSKKTNDEIGQLKKKYNYKLLESFYKHSLENEMYPTLDDSTWHDLNMNEVFSKLDWTITTPGEQVLYKTLRSPAMDKGPILEKGNVINKLNNKEISEPIRGELARIGRIKYDVDTIQVLNKIKPNKPLKNICRLLAFLNVANLIALIVFLLPMFIINAIILFVLSLVMHYKIEDVIHRELQFVDYITKLIGRSNNIGDMLPEGVADYKNKLKATHNKCKPILRKASVLFKIQGLNVIADYINIFLFVKERNFFNIVTGFEKNREDIFELYTLLGEIDVNIAINYYRDSLEYYTEPNFTDNKKTLNVEGLVHPLLDDPISNTLEINNFDVVITGSNMSGKSTFLRTIGVNALLAQTINTVLAKTYTASIFNIITSISLNDDVLQGKSYYLSEAEAVKRIILSSKEDITCLSLIDEIFKGTNPVERINAAAEILNYLNKSNTLTFVATHDLQLIPMLEGYKSYYFKEEVSEEEGMIFDYKIKEGISSTKNAIKILEFLNYPKELTDKINERIKKSEHK